jgi:protein TonB
MNQLALYNSFEQSETRRWSLSAIVVVLGHLALLAATLTWYARPDIPGVASNAISIDLAPSSASPTVQTLDVAPGPQMQEALAPVPEQLQKPVEEEKLPPAPVQQNPAVVAPSTPEQKPVIDKPQPVLRKPQPVQPPAPVTSAPQKADVQAPTRDAQSGTAAAAKALLTYRQILAAHLQRFKQYPAAARAAHEEGSAMVNFTVSRSGQVSSLSLIRSSGHASLDNEALAAIRRAQPLPTFPPEITQSAMSFPVPFSFSLR